MHLPPTGCMLTAATVLRGNWNRGPVPAYVGAVHPTATTRPATALPTSNDYFVKQDTFACRSKELFERSVRYLVDRDEGAYKKLLLGGVASGQCVFLKEGEKVFLGDTAIFSGLVCARPKGEMDCFWTYTEAVARRYPDGRSIYFAPR
jgi:hypothetical protein